MLNLGCFDAAETSAADIVPLVSGASTSQSLPRKWSAKARKHLLHKSWLEIRSANLSPICSNGLGMPIKTEKKTSDGSTMGKHMNLNNSRLGFRQHPLQFLAFVTNQTWLNIKSVQSISISTSKNIIKHENSRIWPVFW